MYTRKICFQTHSKTRREEGKQGSLAYIPKTEATSLATLERYSVTQMCINRNQVNSNKAVIIFLKSIRAYLSVRAKQNHVCDVQKKKQNKKQTKKPPARWIFIIDADRCGLSRPCQSVPVPYIAAITVVKANALLARCSSGEYTSRVMVKSSHMVACIK